jgi:prephenate dehydrogenase
MIGIIGFGRFGKLTARYLAEDFDVFVFNRTDKSVEIKKSGARKASLNTVCQQKIVILCVPISTLKEVLVEIGPLLNKDSVVVDVCSCLKRSRFSRPIRYSDPIALRIP